MIDPNTIKLKIISLPLFNEIGYIRLAEYDNDIDLPHLEYGMGNENFRNKGIMSKELPLFLEECKKDYSTLTAVVSTDNIASIKLLEKNSFLRIREVGEKYWYLLCFDIGIKRAKKILKEFREVYS